MFVVSGVHTLDYCKLQSREGVLNRYLKDQQAQLEALNALQDLTAHMENPRGEWCLHRTAATLNNAVVLKFSRNYTNTCFTLT